MATLVRSVEGHQRRRLVDWELCSTPPDLFDGPAALNAAPLNWNAAKEAGTAAACLRSEGLWSLDTPATRFDTHDWWYRTRFPRPSPQDRQQIVLGFDGLATVADIWLNGTPLLSSNNMFIASECVIDELLGDDNQLVIRFRALDSLLSAKKPRPKWRAPMIENQQIRWIRTTLLGRTPGWSPPAAPVGPWRPVWLESRKHLTVPALSWRSGVSGDTGWIELECSAKRLGNAEIVGATLVVQRNGAVHCMPLHCDPIGHLYTGRLEIPNIALWWPHTHGEPALYAAHLQIRLDGTNEVKVELGKVGFRTLTLDTRDGNFELRVNGVAIFCRGACWMPPDPVSLSASPQELSESLAQVRAAGMNMLRVGGMTVYESDDFLDACDANGILLWQDFMFANMNYPEDDPAFNTSVTTEARQQVSRLSIHPCLAVLCGNSEAEQQAAMWGAPREDWSPRLFHRLLADIAHEICPDVPYWPSSAHGGAFPHQGNAGTTSYYGVGAYLRPLEDARRAEIRFASECLAFANIPEERTLLKIPGTGPVRAHHPAWKARSPRDLGAGWDFDDVRDFYVARLFGVDPMQVRYADHELYLALGRVAPGEVMAAVFAEWRRKRSTCHGGLIWFWRDLWCGAGWGVVDALGTPKSVYHYLRRVLQPQTVSITDEGGNGLFIHVCNEQAQPLEAILELTSYRHGETVTGKGERALVVPARETLEMSALELFAGFLDLSYAYRFGPPAQNLVVATLRGRDGHTASQAFHFDPGQMASRRSDIGLSAIAAPRPDGGMDLTVRSERFAQSIWLEADDFRAEDEYFHLAPGQSRTVRLLAVPGSKPRPLRGRVHALNGTHPVRIDVSP